MIKNLNLNLIFNKPLFYFKELQLFNNKMNTDQGLLSSTRNTNFNSNPNSNLPNNTSLNSSSNLFNLHTILFV